MRVIRRHSVWSVIITLMSVIVVAAQGATCAGLLEDALIAVEDNCIGAGRNQVCYGYDSVSASFVTDVSEDFFTQPSDLSALEDLETIQTAALDVANDIWGVALMNIQADLPNTLPGQYVTFVILGDVEVGNTVEEAFEPSDGVEVVISSPAGANIRSGAGLNFNVIGGAAPDAVLLADGVSPDGDWFRVAYDERVAWVNRTVIDDTAEGLDELPTLTNELQTPMQSFYLRTGIGQPECEDVPDDVLLVQGPEEIEVNISVNGVDIRIGSTVALRFVENENGEIVMQIISVSGNIVVDGVPMLPGQVINYGVEEGPDSLPVVTDEPTAPEFLEEFGAEFCTVERLPVSLLNYQVEILCPGEEIPVVETTNNSNANTPNNSNNNNPVVGGTQSQVSGFSCDSFQRLSPSGNVDSGNQVFSWTSVGEGVEYELVFWNSGQQVNTFRTTATSLELNLGGETNTGGSFSWEVRAFTTGNEYICVTERSPELVRTGEMNPPVVEVPVQQQSLQASFVSCEIIEGTEITIEWSSALTLPGVITWDDSYYGPESQPFNTESGTTVIDTYYGLSGLTVTSGSESVSIAVPAGCFTTPD
ncbi:MAG: hypothetical protein AAFV93_09445 [Chloroflexota bacterium]